MTRNAFNLLNLREFFFNHTSEKNLIFFQIVVRNSCICMHIIPYIFGEFILEKRKLLPRRFGN